MSIVYASRSVDIWRPPIGKDSYRPSQVPYTLVVPSWRAHVDRIPRITSSFDITQGQEQQLEVHYVFDPVDVRYYDKVHDLLTGIWYKVVWVMDHKNEVPTKYGGNFDYTEALVLLVTGES